jgi:iron(III) transport system ATP-binding protein
VQVRRELRDLQRRLGITTIFVTHDQEEANTMCDRIAVMNEGVVQQVGTPMEVYEKPTNLFVAGFLGSANVLDGEVVGSGPDRVFRMDGLRFPVPPSVELPAGAKLVFRPQDAVLGEEPQGMAMTGTIAHREFLGSYVRYGVTVGATEVFIDRPFQAGDRLYEPGRPVRIGVSPSAALWLAN